MMQTSVDTHLPLLPGLTLGTQGDGPPRIICLPVVELVKTAGVLQLKPSARYSTSMSCCSVQDAVYCLISWILTLLIGLVSIIREHMWYVSWKIVILLLSFGFTKGQPSFLLAVTCRYSLSVVTGHILLICPSASFLRVYFKYFLMNLLNLLWYQWSHCYTKICHSCSKIW